MCMCIIFINDLPKNGKNNYDYCMEGLTIWQNRRQLCNITSILKENEIRSHLTIRFDDNNMHIVFCSAK